MSSNDWPEHQQQLRGVQQDREAVARAVSVIQQEKHVTRQSATRLLVGLAQLRRRVVSDIAADVVRNGRLPEA